MRLLIIYLIASLVRRLGNSEDGLDEEVSKDGDDTEYNRDQEIIMGRNPVMRRVPC